MAHVLLIEDDEVLARMYQDKLVKNGFEVTVAFDGEDGLAKSRRLIPDFILLDIMMPKMNGLEVLSKIKSDPQTKVIPVMVLTNLAGTKESQQALLSGAHSYVIKSDYTPLQIVERIKEILKIS